MPHALALQNAGEQLGFLDRRGADQHRLLLFVQLGDLIGDRLVFFLVVRKTTSEFSTRSNGLFVGMTTISSL